MQFLVNDILCVCVLTVKGFRNYQLIRSSFTFFLQFMYSKRVAVERKALFRFLTFFSNGLNFQLILLLIRFHYNISFVFYRIKIPEININLDWLHCRYTIFIGIEYYFVCLFCSSWNPFSLLYFVADICTSYYYK